MMQVRVVVPVPARVAVQVRMRVAVLVPPAGIDATSAATTGGAVPVRRVVRVPVGIVGTRIAARVPVGIVGTRIAARVRVAGIAAARVAMMRAAVQVQARVAVPVAPAVGIVGTRIAALVPVGIVATTAMQVQARVAVPVAIVGTRIAVLAGIVATRVAMTRARVAVVAAAAEFVATRAAGRAPKATIAVASTRVARTKVRSANTQAAGIDRSVQKMLDPGAGLVLQVASRQECVVVRGARHAELLETAVEMDHEHEAREDLANAAGFEDLRAAVVAAQVKRRFAEAVAAMRIDPIVEALRSLLVVHAIEGRAASGDRLAMVALAARVKVGASGRAHLSAAKDELSLSVPA